MGDGGEQELKPPASEQAKSGQAKSEQAKSEHQAPPQQKHAVLAAAGALLARIVHLGSSSPAPLASTAPPGIEAAHDDLELAIVDGIKKKEGVRPHKFGGFVHDPTNEAEVRFAKALPQVTAFINEVLAKKGMKDLQLTEAEIAVNFIAEAAPVLQENKTSAFTGGEYDTTNFQLDRFIVQYEQLRSWLPSSVHAEVDRSIAKHGILVDRDSPQYEEIMDPISIETGMYANAAMFAVALSQLDHDLADRGISIAKLDRHARFFWTTVYYNGGATAGLALLKKKDVDYYKEKFKGIDDPASSARYQNYNAKWRLATLELLEDNDIFFGQDSKPPAK